MIRQIRDEPEAYNTCIKQTLEAMRGLNETTLQSASAVQNALLEKWISSSILKRKRHGFYNDAFILWLDAGRQTIAVKIHEDCFENCKRIYDASDLLDALTASGDIAPVLSTSSIDKYRVVFYLWQEGEMPTETIKEGAKWCSELIHALKKRIESLLIKRYGLHGISDNFTYPEENEFLCTPRWLIVLDVNKIVPMKTLPLRPEELAKRIIDIWIQRKKA